MLGDSISRFKLHLSAVGLIKVLKSSCLSSLLILCGNIIPITRMRFFDACFQNNFREKLPLAVLYQSAILTFSILFHIQNSFFNSGN